MYGLSINKHFYETLVEHRSIFYYLIISTLSVDRLFLILCLYSLKAQPSSLVTVIKKSPVKIDSYDELVNFVLRHKWKFNISEFA